MNSFLAEVNNATRTQDDVERFETLSLGIPTADRRNGERASMRPLIEVQDDADQKPLLTEVSSTTTPQPVIKGSVLETRDKGQQQQQTHRPDVSIFANRTYLKPNLAGSFEVEAREILKGQPPLEDIEAVLAYIQYGIDGKTNFNIRFTGAASSQLIRVLLTVTLPDIWLDTSDQNEVAVTSRIQKILRNAFLCVAGIEGILEQIRNHLNLRSYSDRSILSTYASFLAHLLAPDDTVTTLLHDATKLYQKDFQSRLFWQSITSLLAGSKILATMGLVTTSIRDFPSLQQSSSWLSDGTKYSQWLARNIVKAAVDSPVSDDSTWVRLCDFFQKSLSLGYRDILVSHVYKSLLLGPAALWPQFARLTISLNHRHQKAVLSEILISVSQSQPQRAEGAAPDDQSGPLTDFIAASAALLSGLIEHDTSMAEHAVEWLSSPQDVRTISLVSRRAMIAALTPVEGLMSRVLQNSMTAFSDKIQIQQTPVASQEHLAQVILLCAGKCSRADTSMLKQHSFTALTMQSISNHLNATVPQVRLLGMIVGVGISRCVDVLGKQLNFDDEQMDSAEANSFLNLINIDDQVGDLQGLKDRLHQPSDSIAKTHPRNPKLNADLRTPSASKITEIQELPSSDDEDDLIPYQKPSDDPEDSDEDPTLINRDKPKPPLYIVDLIKQLQQPADKLDIIAAALKTAAPLIRRKGGFGTELSDNIYGLISALINLQDGMSGNVQEQQKLNAMVACLVTQPEKVAKHLIITYFEGDFSLTQRSGLLATIGIGARELAGFSEFKPAVEIDDMFPSKRLPAHLIPDASAQSPKVSSAASRNIMLLSNSVTWSGITPLADAAANAQSGSDILKIAQTTRKSSSLSIKAEKDARYLERTKKVPRNIYEILCSQIFVPLASPLAAILWYTATNSSGSHTTLLHRSVLSLHLQTLTLLLHTLGSPGMGVTTISAAITYETITLLNGLQKNSQLALDPAVLPAALALLFALIDITVQTGVSAQERLLSHDFGDRVAELVRWTASLNDMSGVPAPTEGSTGNGSVAWTVLAAGIQVRWYELGRRFQNRMLGFDIDP